ncbi:fumarylacetoacetate hydrolase family protein [Halosimplex pelagicum]|uniref:Fumarylacetoacetate hydrolase family protein n=1 Tax=Halosimplex pelagicum TaxID=869886 RepID=A0A7D5PH37_9EURY|nr:fumarylacetoacetate hydrolase family protein [Halosimplex pelagicum]QLH84779.1 fumarylacetoacetate hydrolase family protein [Halosimplex pelagicum]
MRYYRSDRGGSISLIAADESAAYDLSETEAEPTSFLELASAASLTDRTVDDVARGLVEEAPTIELASVEDDLVRPIDPDEVWAAGVTYSISQEARQEEGGLAESYLEAYEGDRPEVYFKATPSRTVGPNDRVGIRGDSDWDAPEPEMTIVLYDEEIVGFTVGNDMCSRSIERENLLYLPQSKIYAKNCAIGPCIATGDTVGDPLDLEMHMSIERDGETVFEEGTSTAELVRTCEELVDYYTRYNEVPEASVLLTGTSIMVPDDVSLEEDDVISIEIEDIGVLTNTVEQL